MDNIYETNSANISEAFYPTLYQRLEDMISDDEKSVDKRWVDPANGAIIFIDWAMSHGFDRTHRYLWRYDDKIIYCPENCCWKTLEEYEASSKIRYEEKKKAKHVEANVQAPYYPSMSKSILSSDLEGTI